MACTAWSASAVVPIILFCVLFSSAPLTAAENVLVSASHGEGSHYFVGKTVGKYLAKRGHNVTVLLSNAYAHRAENPADSELNFIIFNHSVPSEVVHERHRLYSKLALEPMGPFIFKIVQSQRQGMVDDCEDLLTRNPDVMRQLEEGNFSLVIIDMIWPCSMIITLKMNLTAVISFPMATPSMFSTVAGNPVNLAYTPATMTGFTHPMSLLQRVANVINDRVLSLALWYIQLPFDELRQRHQIRPDLSGSMMDLIASYPDLFLINLDFAIEFPVPLPPNIIPMGGITAVPPKPLSDDLEEFMQSSGDEGVILFTLGTYVHQVRSDFLEPFAEVFGRLQQKVLWQLKGEHELRIPKNVKTMPWLPQNDLLGHPKTRLLIFQGGNNGFYESQYHGVPVVIVPLTGDAIDAAARARHHGFGVVIEKNNVTSHNLHSAIETILNNDNYTKAAKYRSALLRSRQMHPGDRAAFWVNHVIKHGGGYMKSPALDLNFVQRNLLDVIAFLLTLTAVFLFVIFFIFRCMCRCCIGLYVRSKEKQE